MKEKKHIVENWLPRYTGTPLAEFGEYVLLTNFDNYVEWFAALHGGLVRGIDRPMIPEGVKTEASDLTVTVNYVEGHIKIGIEALKLVRRRGRSVKHLRFEDDFDGGHER